MTNCKNLISILLEVLIPGFLKLSVIIVMKIHFNKRGFDLIELVRMLFMSDSVFLPSSSTYKIFVSLRLFSQPKILRSKKRKPATAQKGQLKKNPTLKL